VLRDAHIKRAVLVGHSMGTPVIQQFYRLFPEKTVGLVIVDGALRVFLPKEQMDQFVNSLRSNYQTAEPAFVDGLLGPIKDEKLVPNLDFRMWEGVSHFLMMERPQEFDHAVQEFLTKNKLLKKLRMPVHFPITQAIEYIRVH